MHLEEGLGKDGLPNVSGHGTQHLLRCVAQVLCDIFADVQQLPLGVSDHHGLDVVLGDSDDEDMMGSGA